MLEKFMVSGYFLSRIDVFKSFFKFGVSGALGTITNLALFFYLVDHLGFPVVLSSVFCFFIAAMQNYLVNHYWTFREKSGIQQPTIKALIKYLISALMGLAVNIAVLQLTLDWFMYISISQFLGIVAGFSINFVIAKKFVFKR